MQQIRTDQAPTPGAYSQGVLVDTSKNNVLFIAGQTGNDRSIEGEPMVDGLGPQITQILKNILAIVEAAGGNASSLVCMQVLLLDRGDYEESWKTYNAAYKAFFEERGVQNLPARSQMWVSKLPYPTENTLAEIVSVAEIPR